MVTKKKPVSKKPVTEKTIKVDMLNTDLARRYIEELSDTKEALYRSRRIRQMYESSREAGELSLEQKAKNLYVWHFGVKDFSEEDIEKMWANVDEATKDQLIEDYLVISGAIFPNPQ